MQHVEKQRLQKFRVAAHLLEVKTLEARERDGVLGVVEQETELAAAHPFRQRVRELPRQRVPEHVERAQRGVKGIQVFDLFVEFAVSSRIELPQPATEKDFDEECEKI